MNDRSMSSVYKWLPVIAVLALAGLLLSGPMQAAALNGPAQIAEVTLHVYGAGGPRAPMQESLQMFKERTGVDYELVVGPTGSWLEAAKQNGDLVFFGAEYVMDAFQEGFTYAGDSRLVTEGLILDESRTSTWERGSAILVRPGNPLKIRKFADLAKPGINILVVHGAGQTGLWEDMAAKARMVPQIRENIGAIARDGADAIQKWNENPELNAWITWESWHYRLPDQTQLVKVSENIVIYRGTPIAILARSEHPDTAMEFINFLLTPEAHSIFIKWGWR